MILLPPRGKDSLTFLTLNQTNHKSTPNWQFPPFFNYNRVAVQFLRWALQPASWRHSYRFTPAFTTSPSLLVPSWEHFNMLELLTMKRSKKITPTKHLPWLLYLSSYHPFLILAFLPKPLDWVAYFSPSTPSSIHWNLDSAPTRKLLSRVISDFQGT